jgi:predicted TIM-barrel fold metal-dependent hydrolase
MMRLIDAQIHIWEASRSDRPWPANRQGYVHGPATVTADEIVARMDKAGVGGAILIPPSFEGDRNDLVLDAVNRYPDRFRALSRLTLDAPDARQQVEKLASMWQFPGTRITFAGPMHGWLKAGTLDWFWPVAQELGMRVSIYPFGQVEAIEPVLRSYPSLKFSLDHLALGLDVKDAAIMPVIEQVLRLARYPNLAVKATCLPSYVTEPYPFPTLRTVLRRVLDAYGPHRVFWGSDLTRLTCSYEELIRFFNESMAGLSARDVELVMGGAAAEWYGWEPPQSSR